MYRSDDRTEKREILEVGLKGFSGQLEARDKEAQKITVRFIIGTLTLKTEDGNKGRESLGR